MSGAKKMYGTTAVVRLVYVFDGHKKMPCKNRDINRAPATLITQWIYFSTAKLQTIFGTAKQFRNKNE